MINQTATLRFWSGLISELRAARGMSLRELEKRSGVTRMTIRKLESGKSSPNVMTLEALLDVFEHDLEVIDRKYT